MGYFLMSESQSDWTDSSEGEKFHSEDVSLQVDLRVSSLEADVAYFQAQLELIGDPESRHQDALRKTYITLESSLQTILESLRRKEYNPYVFREWD